MVSEVAVIPGAEPFFYEGGDAGCLLVHGFTGNPSSLKPMAEYLAGRGITVVGPRLEGHGTSVEDMARCCYGDWLESAEEGLHELKQRCSFIFVSGLSMGGTIALYLAARYPGDVKGVIPICAPVMFKGVQYALAPLLKTFVKTVGGVSSDIKDPASKESAYVKVPVAAVPELLKICRLVKGELSSIKQPALIFAARQDHVVDPANASYIRDHLGSAEKELVWLENSYHVATLDYDKETIFSRTAEFITRTSQLMLSS